MTHEYGAPPSQAAPTCPRHPGVVSYVACQRCERPVCPQCQVPASVGVHCVDCAALARRETPDAVRRSLAGLRPPYVTYGLTGLIAAVYVAQLAAPAVTDWLALVPALGLLEPWRLLTNAFVHATDTPMHLHIIGNAMLLVLLGRVVEPAMGTLRYAVMCLLSALGGSLLIVWTAAPPISDHSRMEWLSSYVGISTVGYGLMCALLLLALRGGGDVRGAATLLAMNVVFSLMVPNVSWMGHLGGALAGSAATWALLWGPGAARPRRAWLVLGLGLVITAIGVVARYAMIPAYWGGLA